MRIAISIILSIVWVSLSAQSNYVEDCFSAGCSTHSKTSLLNIDGYTSDNTPFVYSGNTFQTCFEVLNWGPIGISGMHGTVPKSGSGLSDATSISFNSINGATSTDWIWSEYCTESCCNPMGGGCCSNNTGSGYCSPPHGDDWGFFIDGDFLVVCSGSSNDSIPSNNGSLVVSPTAEFCIDVTADCGGLAVEEIDSEIFWEIYGDGESGPWGLGGEPNNSCFCESGSADCWIDIKVICCDPPTVQSNSANSILTSSNSSCNSDITDLFVNGDISNPNYQYDWSGPAGPGPNEATWDASSSPPLPIPPPIGMYQLTVTNLLDTACPLQFDLEILNQGFAEINDLTVCLESGGTIIHSGVGQQVGGAFCSLTGITCYDDSDPNNPGTGPTVVIDPNQILPSSVGNHTMLVIDGSTGNACFDLASANLEILSAANCSLPNHIFLNSRAILNGNYNVGNGLMNDDLRVAGLIPILEPYTGLGYSHFNGGGGETLSSSVLTVTGSNAIVDWVFLELRDALNPAIVIATRSALLQRDGDIVDIDGLSEVDFNLAAGSYYVAIRHRNHLSVMTAQAQDFSTGMGMTIDFTQSAQSTYGLNATKEQSGINMLWSGNGNSDSKVTFQGSGSDILTITNTVFSDPSNAAFQLSFPSMGYHIGDYNLDGTVIYQGSGSDILSITQSVFGNPANVNFELTFPIIEQLP